MQQVIQMIVAQLIEKISNAVGNNAEFIYDRRHNKVESEWLLCTLELNAFKKNVKLLLRKPKE